MLFLGIILWKGTLRFNERGGCFSDAGDFIFKWGNASWGGGHRFWWGDFEKNHWIEDPSPPPTTMGNHAFSSSFMSWLIIIWSTFFISFLLPFSSTTSSVFCRISIIHNMEKCEHTFEKSISETLKAKDFLFEIKIVSYSLVNYFLVLGIRLQTGLYTITTL